jgi:hypothetical protein
MSRQESTESRRLASNRLAYLQAVRGSPTIKDRHPRPRHSAATGVRGTTAVASNDGGDRFTGRFRLW